MAEYYDVEYLNGKLICHLPITRPTSKVRILRSDQPLASRGNQLSRGDFVEWQISYFADEQHQRLAELGKLLELAYRHNVIKEKQLRQLLTEIQKNQEFFSEKYSISIDTSTLPKDFHGFKVLKKAVPILQKDIDNVSVWVELRHKQRATGFQPMLYLRIPIEHAKPNLLGRTAESKEIVVWEPSVAILFGVVRGFAVASKKHLKDMIDVLDRVLKTRRNSP